MKILLVITDYGSFNNFLSEVAVQLIKEGNQVSVICSSQKVINFSDKASYTQLGIVFYFVDFPRSYNIFKQINTSRKVNKLIDAISPDIINIHFTTGIFTTLLWKKPSYFTIGTIHGLGYPVVEGYLKKFVFKAIEEFCFKRLDQIFLLNDFDYQLVKKQYPLKTFKYNSYGVGCDLKKFDRTQFSIDDKKLIRKQLGIVADDFVLAYTGRFVSFKGFDIAVRSVTSLIKDKQLSNIKLILIGGKDTVHKTGLTPGEEEFYQSNTSFIKVGFTSQVEKYLSETDVLIFPSTKEGMPVCIMEAIAMGIPVITANTRGCKDLVINNFNGILLSEKPTIKEMSESILKLYYNTILLKELSINSFKEREMFDRSKFVNEQINIYRQVFKNFLN